ncbi:MAG: hypothetical protein EPO08_11435 [Rhodospirillaceae bacterium]|nr:MAG: hypothetical protein EPO08_11435 [Rhodospirillaceae bacterium]
MSNTDRKDESTGLFYNGPSNTPYSTPDSKPATNGTSVTTYDSNGTAKPATMIGGTVQTNKSSK